MLGAESRVGAMLSRGGWCVRCQGEGAVGVGEPRKTS